MPLTLTPNTVNLELEGITVALPLLKGSEGEVGIDIAQLRNKTGAITFDPGFGNTGACRSAITFIDGEKGILRYRGYPIEELSEKSTFLEVAWLLIHGELPSAAELAAFKIRAVPININYRYVTDELRYMLDNADLVALIHQREFAPVIADVIGGQ
jgi:hypothetical protein